MYGQQIHPIANHRLKVKMVSYLYTHWKMKNFDL